MEEVKLVHDGDARDLVIDNGRERELNCPQLIR